MKLRTYRTWTDTNQVLITAETIKAAKLLAKSIQGYNSTHSVHWDHNAEPLDRPAIELLPPRELSWLERNL